MYYVNYTMGISVENPSAGPAGVGNSGIPYSCPHKAGFAAAFLVNRYFTQYITYGSAADVSFAPLWAQFALKNHPPLSPEARPHLI